MDPGEGLCPVDNSEVFISLSEPVFPSPRCKCMQPVTQGVLLRCNCRVIAGLFVELVVCPCQERAGFSGYWRHAAVTVSLGSAGAEPACVCLS